MNNTLLIERGVHQTRVAVLEDDRLAEIHIERRRGRGVVGNCYRGRVNRVLPGMHAAFIDVGLPRDAFLWAGDAPGAGDSEEGDPPAIDELLSPGDEILVQVTKDALPRKGARVTSKVSLPGRYLVLLPGVDHIGVSRRIEDEEEEARLRQLAQPLLSPGVGWIVRTQAEGCSAETLSQDHVGLLEMWKEVQARYEEASAPALLHRDASVDLRLVRDLFNSTFERLIVDDEEAYGEIVALLTRFEPSLVERVELEPSAPGVLFSRHGVEKQIEAALKRQVWLPSGGYLIIQQTEALVSIDVNTGRFVGKRDLEETVLQTNLEAVREIVRQIRLRDLGGILVIDLIDMTPEENRRRVMEELDKHLAKDRSRSNVLGLSDFGLLQITRKRSRSNLYSQLLRQCPCCSGTGTVKSLDTLALALRDEVVCEIEEGRPGLLRVKVPADLALHLRGRDHAILDEIEERLGGTLDIEVDSSLAIDTFEVVRV